MKAENSAHARLNGASSVSIDAAMLARGASATRPLAAVGRRSTQAHASAPESTRPRRDKIFRACRRDRNRYECRRAGAQNSPATIEWYPDQREWDRKESRRRPVPVLQRHYCGIQPPDLSIRRAKRGPAFGSRAFAHAASCQPAGPAPQRCAMPLACCCLPVQGLGGKSAAHGGPAQLDLEKLPVGDPLSESGRTRRAGRQRHVFPAQRAGNTCRLAETKQSEIEPRSRSENDVRFWTVTGR